MKKLTHLKYSKYLSKFFIILTCNYLSLSCGSEEVVDKEDGGRTRPLTKVLIKTNEINPKNPNDEKIRNTNDNHIIDPNNPDLSKIPNNPNVIDTKSPNDEKTNNTNDKDSNNSDISTHINAQSVDINELKAKPLKFKPVSMLVPECSDKELSKYKELLNNTENIDEFKTIFKKLILKLTLNSCMILSKYALVIPRYKKNYLDILKYVQEKKLLTSCIIILCKLVLDQAKQNERQDILTNLKTLGFNDQQLADLSAYIPQKKI